MEHLEDFAQECDPLAPGLAPLVRGLDWDRGAGRMEGREDGRKRPDKIACSCCSWGSPAGSWLKKHG